MPGDDQIPEPMADDSTPGGLSRRRLLGGAAAGGAALLGVGHERRSGRGRDHVHHRQQAAEGAGQLRHRPHHRGDHGEPLVRPLPRVGEGGGRSQGQAEVQGRARAWPIRSGTSTRSPGDPYHDPNHSHAGGLAELNGGRATVGCWPTTTTSTRSATTGTPTSTSTGGPRRTGPSATGSSRRSSGPTYPNRFYTHSAQTDRITNTTAVATMPTIWDSPGHGRARRALLLLRPAVHRPLRRQVRLDQPPDRGLLHRLQQRQPGRRHLHRPPLLHHSQRGPVRRPPARRHPARPVVPQPDLPGRDLRAAVVDDPPGHHLRRVGRLLRPRRPGRGARRRARERPAGLPHPDAAHRSPGPTPQRVAPGVRPHVDPQVHRVALRPARR